MICDVILILVLGFFAWQGKRRGLFRSAFGFLAVILSYIVSGLVSKPIGDMFKSTGAYDILYKKVEEFVPKTTAPEGLGILNSVISDTKDAMTASLTDVVANIIIYVLAFIVVFLAVKIIFKLLNSIFKLPGLNFLNKLGGLIFGTVTGFLLVYVVLAVWGVSTLFTVPDILSESYLVKSMFEYNILFMLIS